MHFSVLLCNEISSRRTEHLEVSWWIQESLNLNFNCLFLEQNCKSINVIMNTMKPKKKLFLCTLIHTFPIRTSPWLALKLNEANFVLTCFQCEQEHQVNLNMKKASIKMYFHSSFFPGTSLCIIFLKFWVF